ncbi:MAG: MFS transporter, partial [Pseudomonadota bacterium]|nr:MFS transporter [Pseudomonadota bacterium]
LDPRVDEQVVQDQMQTAVVDPEPEVDPELDQPEPVTEPPEHPDPDDHPHDLSRARP